MHLIIIREMQVVPGSGAIGKESLIQLIQTKKAPLQELFVARSGVEPETFGL